MDWNRAPRDVPREGAMPMVAALILRREVNGGGNVGGGGCRIGLKPSLGFIWTSHLSHVSSHTVTS